MSKCTMRGGKRSVKKANSHKKRGGKKCCVGGKKTRARTHKKRGGMSCNKGSKKTRGRTHKKRGGKKTLMQRLGF